MKDSIIIEGREFISVGRAAEITKYTKDYVGQLCRGGKVAARMIGRTWFIDRESLSLYKNSVDSGAAQVAHTHAALYAENQIAKLASQKQVVSPVIPAEKALEIKYVSDGRAALPELNKAQSQTSSVVTANEKVLASVESKLMSPATVKVVAQIKKRALGSFSGYVPTTRKMMTAILPIVLFAVGVFGAMLPSGTISSLSRSTAGTLSKTNNSSMTASVWSSVGCGFASVLFGGSEWCSVSGSSSFVIVPPQETKSTTQTQVATTPVIKTTAPIQSTVTERIVVQPQTVYVNQTDTSLAQRVSALEAADLTDRLYNQLQTDRIFNSIENSDGGSNGSSGSSNVDITNIDGSTITNSSFSGSTGIFSSNVTIGGTVAVSGSGTSTISNGLEVGNLHINGTITGAGLADCAGSADKIIWSGGSFSCGVDAGGSGLGISSLGAQYSTTQTGASQTFATSSDANIQLTITSSGDTHTFTPVWNGTLSAARGGTGISSVSANQILLGNSSGTGWTQTATSSLGLPTFASLDSYLTLSNWYATTTDGLDEGLNNLYFTSDRVQTYLNTLAKGYFFSTTSATYWDSVQSRWATTSSDYWLTTKTTDDLAETVTNRYYSNTLVNAYIHASTTIPKTYTTNTFSELQTFTAGLTTNALTIGSLSGILYGTNGSVGTIATSTLNIALSDTTGTLAVSRGGTGLASIPTYGQMLVGNGSGYSLVATSTLGINFSSIIGTVGVSQGGTGATSFGQGWIYSTGSGALGASTSPTVAYITATSTTATSTLSNIFATNLRLSGRFYDGSNSAGTNGMILQTTGSGTQWVATSSLGIVSGTSYSDADVNAYIAASTTIPKTYTSNTFSGLQTFGNASTTNLSASYASTTNLLTGSLTVGSITGALQAVNGVVSATSTLSQVYGGTGITSYVPGDILYADNTGTLTRLPKSFDGLVLKLNGGLPSWQTDLASGGAGGATAWSTTTDSLGIYSTDTTDVIIIGSNATTSTGNILEVVGNTKLGGNVSVTGTLAVGSLTGILYGTNGSVGTISTSTLNIAISNTTGTLAVSRGGTGLTSTPSYGQLLVGNGSGYSLMATSSLGLGPVGSVNEIQFNNGGVLGASSKLTFSTTTGKFEVNNSSTQFIRFDPANLITEIVAGTDLYFGLASSPRQMRIVDTGEGDTIEIQSDNYDDAYALNVGKSQRNSAGGNGIRTTRLHVSHDDSVFTGPSWDLWSDPVTGYIGMGTSSPYAVLSVVGQTVSEYFTATSTTATSTLPNIFATNLRLSGRLYDGSNSAGTNGMILQTTGSGTQWVATSSLGLSYTNADVNAFIHASTTIPKTYSTNTFSALQTLTAGLTTNALTVGSLNGPLQANNGVVSATSSIGVLYGGTGLTTAPSYGQLLLGNSTGGYTLTATSSLGLLSSLAIGSGTQGQIPFYNAAGNNLTATSSIFIAQSGNVGIGTTSPTTKLDVKGNVTVTPTTDGQSVFRMNLANGSPSFQLGSYPGFSQYSGFWAGNITPSASNFTFIADGSTETIFNVPSGGNMRFRINNASGPNAMNLNAAGLSVNTDSGASRLSIAGNAGIGSTYADLAAPTNGLIVEGNVGIGTDTPANALDVVGTINGDALTFNGTGSITVDQFVGTGFDFNFGGGAGAFRMTTADLYGTNDQFFQFNNNSGSYGAIEAGGSGLVLGTYNTSPIIFSPNRIEALRIVNGGNIGIGTTSPYAKLSVVGQTVSEYFTATSTRVASTFP
ncbi:MAG: hypothetical protein RLY66_535, partial [Candidatus Parcubacteria bacterium]